MIIRTIVRSPRPLAPVAPIEKAISHSPDVQQRQLEFMDWIRFLDSQAR